MKQLNLVSLQLTTPQLCEGHTLVAGPSTAQELIVDSCVGWQINFSKRTVAVGKTCLTLYINWSPLGIVINWALLREIFLRCDMICLITSQQRPPYLTSIKTHRDSGLRTSSSKLASCLQSICSLFVLAICQYNDAMAVYFSRFLTGSNSKIRWLWPPRGRSRFTGNAYSMWTVAMELNQEGDVGRRCNPTYRNKR